MRWSGETPDARQIREESEWQTGYAVFPVQTSEGTWVWLERFEWRYSRTGTGHRDYVSRPAGSSWEPTPFVYPPGPALRPKL